MAKFGEYPPLEYGLRDALKEEKRRDIKARNAKEARYMAVLHGVIDTTADVAEVDREKLRGALRATGALGLMIEAFKNAVRYWEYNGELPDNFGLERSPTDGSEPAAEVVSFERH